MYEPVCNRVAFIRSSYNEFLIFVERLITQKGLFSSFENMAKMLFLMKELIRQTQLK